MRGVPGVQVQVPGFRLARAGAEVDPAVPPRGGELFQLRQDPAVLVPGRANAPAPQPDVPGPTPNSRRGTFPPRPTGSRPEETRSRPVDCAPSDVRRCCSVPIPEECSGRSSGLAERATSGPGSLASMKALARIVTSDCGDVATKCPGIPSAATVSPGPRNCSSPALCSASISRSRRGGGPESTKLKKPCHQPWTSWWPANRRPPKGRSSLRAGRYRNCLPAAAR